MERQERFFSGGYFYVGFSSLHAMYKMHCERQTAIDAETPAVAVPHA